ncbi:Response regulator receiver domain-containing protein [Flavobacterium sp. CF108]|jgi:CheY-like chemotaxis protein|uniref:response regulator n=1 Tax=unclassified Flavobacterium TaxID=196869 RepID=UPI0008B821D2|nr:MULTISPECIES: response regulator [unclassified Flavobacterium]SEO70094.1 Response regulator receiver domain-containing protein [Flavobacterium sp. fv08]SHH90761.1 Response regulator receiver domain-containing protein [Flavobacterium sp. CF108]
MRKPNILLIEDDELDTISVERSLKKLEIQYILHTAYNGLEALKLLRDPEDLLVPDVILLDINMPKMNGIEFLRIIRSDENLKDLNVFIMTTSSESNDRVTAEELGISGYIIKPLNYNDNTKRPDSMDAFVQFHLRKILLNENT